MPPYNEHKGRYQDTLRRPKAKKKGLEKQVTDFILGPKGIRVRKTKLLNLDEIRKKRAGTGKYSGGEL